jgi:hypothetical protein
MEALYLPDETYERLLTALQLCEVDPFTREPTRTAIVTALGEIGNIWPNTCREDECECQ